MSDKSYHDVVSERRKGWARQQKLHHTAVEYAYKYHNLDETMLRLISNYEIASDMEDGTISQRENRKLAMREAWHAVIAYVRTFERSGAAAA